MTVIEKVCEKISCAVADELEMDDEKKAVVHEGTEKVPLKLS